MYHDGVAHTDPPEVVYIVCQGAINLYKNGEQSYQVQVK